MVALASKINPMNALRYKVQLKSKSETIFNNIDATAANKEDTICLIIAAVYICILFNRLLISGI